LEAEAAKKQADSDRYAASAKNYQTLTQKRESELAELQKSRDDLNTELKKAKDDNSRLSSEKADLQKKLTAAEADKTELNRKLEAKPPAVLPPVAAPRADGEKASEVGKIEPKKEISAVTVKMNPKDGLPYVWIPPGAFSMGCSPGDSECNQDEQPVRKVTLTKGFWIGQTEVTQAAYQKVIGSNPSHVKGKKLPVESVSWTDAARYCAAAGMRLPTEAEWEYAARGGAKEARYGDLDAIAWYSKNSGGRAHEVGTKKANGFGLYDMLGNVWEWTADWWDYYQGAATVDSTGPRWGLSRVVRGGSWDYSSVRASERENFVASSRSTDGGVRCVGELP
jgi:formylglycine-generating enzyme required for sulfatase activity